jgi:hypothetical protein
MLHAYMLKLSTAPALGTRLPELSTGKLKRKESLSRNGWSNENLHLT